MTKHGKYILWKTDNFVPFVVPVLSSSSSTSPSQDSSRVHRQEHAQVMLQSSNELAAGNWSRNPASDSENSNDRLRDLPEWFEGFEENLEDTEMPAPAHISHDSDSERPAKVASRKHSIYTHLPEDRNCEVCLRTKMTRAPTRRRTGEAVRPADKFGDLITADHKVLNDGGESRNNSPVSSRSTRCGCSMDTILSVRATR